MLVSLESATPFAASVNGLITAAIINGKFDSGKYSQFRDYAHLGVGLTVGSAMLLWDSSVRGLCREISQYLDVTTPFTIGRVARFVTHPMRCPKPRQYKSELLSQEEVESRGFVVERKLL